MGAELRVKIREIVRRCCDRVNTDPDLFEGLVDELTALVAQHEAGFINAKTGFVASEAKAAKPTVLVTPRATAPDGSSMS